MTNSAFVISGNYHEYFAFLDRIGLPRKNTKYIFISDPMRLYGLRNISVLSVGSYWESPVYTSTYIQRKSHVNGITFVDESGKQI